MSTDSPMHAGVMGAEYAAGRLRSPELRFRYQVRARVAVDAYHERHSWKKSYRVLELGAAEGLTLLHIRELLSGRGSFDGVEFSRELIERAPELPQDTRLIEGDVMTLPAELVPESYDLCTVLAVLEHLSDPVACLREALRMLVPGGVLVASCPNPLWDEVAGKLRLVADEHHEQHLTGRDMLRLAREAGFDRLEFRPFMWAPVGVLPYLRIPIDPELALKLDARLASVPLLRQTFVNQLLIAEKPRGT
jgi:SAM-dependent methyltransferase